MYLCPTIYLAIAFCVVTMFCWGSWANTQKLVNKKWRYELFYWDYVFGVVAAAIIFALTIGSTGEFGRSFCDDLRQAAPQALGWAFVGGVVFNIANILLVAAIDIAGMSVAFPVGIGLALVLGVIWNYLLSPSGNAPTLFAGVALVTVAIILSALSYRQRDAANVDATAEKKPIGKGLALALICGVLMSLFYFFVAKSLAQINTGDGLVDVTLDHFKSSPDAVLEPGKLTPYTANVLFAIGVLLSNCVIMPILMRKPFVGEPVEKGAYWKGTLRDHACGWLGGVIWAIGMTLNVIASGVASPAVAYGLGQGATLMSAIWGVFIWREFKGAPKGVGKTLAAMFACFVIGLALIIWTKLDSSAQATTPATQEMIEEAFDAAVPPFEELVDGDKDFAPNAPEDGIEAAVDAVNGAAEGVAETIKEAVDDATEAAAEAIEEVEDALEIEPEAE